jgi:hypothetical protein
MTIHIGPTPIQTFGDFVGALCITVFVLFWLTDFIRHCFHFYYKSHGVHDLCDYNEGHSDHS